NKMIRAAGSLPCKRLTAAAVHKPKDGVPIIKMNDAWADQLTEGRQNSPRQLITVGPNRDCLTAEEVCALGLDVPHHVLPDSINHPKRIEITFPAGVSPGKEPVRSENDSI